MGVSDVRTHHVAAKHEEVGHLGGPVQPDEDVPEGREDGFVLQPISHPCPARWVCPDVDRGACKVGRDDVNQGLSVIRLACDVAALRQLGQRRTRLRFRCCEWCSSAEGLLLR